MQQAVWSLVLQRQVAGGVGAAKGKWSCNIHEAMSRKERGGCSLLIELLNERKPLSALSLEPTVAVCPLAPPPCSDVGSCLPCPSSSAT